MDQLALNVKLADRPDFDNFYPSQANQDVFALLSQAAWCEFPQTIVYGESGCGKSHLLQACCMQIRHQGRTASYLSMRELLRFDVAVLTGFDQAGVVILDDVDSLMGNRVWEEALFHLINHCRQNQQPLLIGLRPNPHEVDCQLPDLASRLLWGPIYKIQALDEQQSIQAFRWRVEKRGLNVSEPVINYINRHYPRDMKSLMQILQQLDNASLSNARKITLQLVNDTLGNVKKT